MKNMSRKQRRKLRQDGLVNDSGINSDKFQLNKLVPLTDGQSAAIDSWNEGYNLFMKGSAGTGKTFLAYHFALTELLSKNVERVIQIRSTVSCRDMGFLPGTKAQKEEPFEEVGKSMVKELIGRNDAHHIMRSSNMLEFRSTAHLRGATFDNSIVIVDEFQNMSFQELDTIMTRAGKNTRYIFSGDTAQDDLSSVRYNEQSGAKEFLKVINLMEEFDVISFYPEDNVRSGLAKSYLLNKEKLWADANKLTVAA